MSMIIGSYGDAYQYGCLGGGLRKKAADREEYASAADAIAKRLDKGAEEDAAPVGNREKLSDSGEEKEGESSIVVVKPDGSRVLIVTTKFAGMVTQRCVQLSEPDKLQDDVGKVLEKPEAGKPGTAQARQENGLDVGENFAELLFADLGDV